MDYNTFLVVKKFIYSDIYREIRIAKASNSKIKRKILKTLGVNAGGSNFLAALGLLCYTEFAGKFKYNKSKASRNFNMFFDELGTDYKKFRKKGIDVYDIYRCGMAHEYHIKNSYTIYMCQKKGSKHCGVGIDKKGEYFFIVEKYFKDFQSAFERLEKDTYGQVTKIKV